MDDFGIENSISTLYYHGYLERQACGYCGSESNCMDGWTAYSLSCSDYQTMIDRGFRRSGHFLYKPDLMKTCCIPYTIRCDALNYKFRNEDKKTLRRFKSFLNSILVESNDSACGKLEMDKNFSCESRDLSSHIDEIFKKFNSIFEIRIVKTTESLDGFTESFNVYSLYQETIHKDPPEKIKFKGNSDSPSINFDFPLVKPVRNITYGSYHQNYYIKGKLFAVGVIDILPNCLSSVYFFYDPKFSHISPGKLSALFEIYFSQKLYYSNKNLSTLKYYYMGYYIKSCGAFNCEQTTKTTRKKEVLTININMSVLNFSESKLNKYPKLKRYISLVGEELAEKQHVFFEENV